MCVKKKFKRTLKPKNLYSSMFGIIGFQSQTYFNWANPNVFETIRKAKYYDSLHS